MTFRIVRGVLAIFGIVALAIVAVALVSMFVGGRGNGDLYTGSGGVLLNPSLLSGAYASDFEPYTEKTEAGNGDLSFGNDSTLGAAIVGELNGPPESLGPNTKIDKFYADSSDRMWTFEVLGLSVVVNVSKTLLALAMLGLGLVSGWLFRDRRAAAEPGDRGDW